MATPTYFNKLLHRPMDRKTFLKTVLLGFLLLSGVSALVRLFGTNKGQRTGATYGGSTYGAPAKTNSQLT